MPDTELQDLQAAVFNAKQAGDRATLEMLRRSVEARGLAHHFIARDFETGSAPVASAIKSTLALKQWKSAVARARGRGDTGLLAGFRKDIERDGLAPHFTEDEFKVPATSPAATRTESTMSAAERRELEEWRRLAPGFIADGVASLRAKYAAGKGKETLDDAIALLRSVLEDKGASEKEKTKAKELLGLLDSDEKKDGAAARAIGSLSADEQSLFARTDPFRLRAQTPAAKRAAAAARAAELAAEYGFRR